MVWYVQPLSLEPAGGQAGEEKDWYDFRGQSLATGFLSHHRVDLPYVPQKPSNLPNIQKVGTQAVYSSKNTHLRSEPYTIPVAMPLALAPPPQRLTHVFPHPPVQRTRYGSEQVTTPSANTDQITDQIHAYLRRTGADRINEIRELRAVRRLRQELKHTLSAIFKPKTD